MKQNTSNQGKAEAAGYVDWVIVGCFALVLVCAAAACLIGLNSSRKQPTAPQTTASPPPAANDREAMQAILPNASPTTETPAPPYVAWEAEAVRRHPALGIDGSPLNTEFMALYKRYQKTRPGYFRDAKWPISLAEKAVASVRDAEQEAQTQQAAAFGTALGIPPRQFKRSLVATKEALRRYPELGIAGSRLNTEFVALYNRYQDTERDILSYPTWPIRLADEAVTSMRAADAEQQAQAQQQSAPQPAIPGLSSAPVAQQQEPQQQSAPQPVAASTTSSQPYFLMAIKEEQNAKSTEPAAMGGWDVEIGEVYQFLRTVSTSEYNGGKPGTDATYVAVAVDDIAVFSRADNFVPVADNVQAAMKYNQEVAQNRQSERDAAAQEAQAQQQSAPTANAQSNGPVRMPMHSRYYDPVMEAWAEDRDRAISEGRQPPPPPDLGGDESQFSSDPTHQLEQQRTRIEDLEDAQRREHFDQMNQQMQDSDDR